jgi:hypothetical protein
VNNPPSRTKNSTNGDKSSSDVTHIVNKIKQGTSNAVKSLDEHCEFNKALQLNNYYKINNCDLNTAEFEICYNSRLDRHYIINRGKREYLEKVRPSSHTKKVVTPKILK